MAAVLGGVFVYEIKNKSLQKLILVLVLIVTFAVTRDYWKVKDYLIKPEAFYTDIYDSTTDTGESSPIWSVRFMEERPKSKIDVIDGKARIKEIFRNSTVHSYEIDAQFRSRIKENTLYFPGWKVYIDGQEYKGVKFQDPAHRGLMTFYVLEGNHKVDIKFEDTKLRRAANIMSLGAYVIFGLVLIKPISILLRK
jgi:hypothetical protein